MGPNVDLLEASPERTQISEFHQRHGSHLRRRCPQHAEPIGHHDDHGTVRRGRPQATHDTKTQVPGQGEVDHHDVGPGPGDGSESVVAGFDVGHDVEAEQAVQGVEQSAGDDGIVLADHRRQRRSGFHHCTQSGTAT